MKDRRVFSQGLANLVTIRRTAPIWSSSPGTIAGHSSPEMVRLLEEYAALLHDLKKPAEAKALLERAEKMRKQNAANFD